MFPGWGRNAQDARATTQLHVSCESSGEPSTPAREWSLLLRRGSRQAFGLHCACERRDQVVVVQGLGLQPCFIAGSVVSTDQVVRPFSRASIARFHGDSGCIPKSAGGSSDIAYEGVGDPSVPLNRTDLI